MPVLYHGDAMEDAGENVWERHLNVEMCVHPEPTEAVLGSPKEQVSFLPLDNEEHVTDYVFLFPLATRKLKAKFVVPKEQLYRFLLICVFLFPVVYNSSYNILVFMFTFLFKLLLYHVFPMIYFPVT